MVGRYACCFEGFADGILGLVLLIYHVRSGHCGGRERRRGFGGGVCSLVDLGGEVQSRAHGRLSCHFGWRAPKAAIFEAHLEMKERQRQLAPACTT